MQFSPYSVLINALTIDANEQMKSCQSLHPTDEVVSTFVYKQMR